MKIKLLVAGWFFLAALISIQSCKDDKEESKPEFIASSSDFANFRSWTEVTTNEGPSPTLSTAHQGEVQNTTRTVYIKDNQNRVDGRFPVGTIIVKDTRDANGNTVEVTAMVKRGGDNFNPDNNDWEWFMLNADGTIMSDQGTVMRGAGLMGGMCGMCHGAVKSNDFVFSK